MAQHNEPKSPRRTYARPDAVRSRTMAAVRSHRNKSTELALIVLMKKAGITGWRRGIQIPGKPDFCFPRERVAVFVDGCFWHGCPVCYRPPKTNPAFWQAKVAYNRQRDSEVTQILRATGWTVVRIWEHQLSLDPAKTIRTLRRALSQRQSKKVPSGTSGDESKP